MDERDYSFESLLALVACLRGPQGCPWDREQTPASLRATLLEECYELLEALDRGDTQQLMEELGDLLIQAAFLIQMAQERKEFTAGEVFQKVTRKLVQRHPHVFGDASLSTAWDVEVSWESHRQQEKGEASILEGVPRTMPALAYSQAIQQRAARTGFDWPRWQDVLRKVQEEIGEMREAGTPEQQEQELGDLLLALVALARRLKVDAESALRKANQRFYRRFTRLERLCRERGLDLRRLSDEQKEALWQEAKAALEQES